MTAGPERLTLREWPLSERPREKMASLGVEYLSDAELLAVLLRIGIPGQDAVSFAMNILAGNDGLAGLSRMSIREMCKIAGIGPGKATTILAAFEMGRRSMMNHAAERKQITNGGDVAEIMEARLRGLDREELHVILLSTKNHVMTVRRVYSGKINSTYVRPSEVFQEAIRENAASIVLAHNHPSGDPTPSNDDVAITRTIIQAGRLLDIEVVDHLVIGDSRHGWVSMRDRMLAFDAASCR